MKRTSHIPPGLAKVDGITYVIPGWHEVPDGTKLEDIIRDWTSQENPIETEAFSEKIKSDSSEKEYVVKWDGKLWNCTCTGFEFRGICKHINKIKSWKK